MATTTTANLSKSSQHVLEALVLGTDTPSGAAAPLSAGTITATIPTAGASAATSVTATVTGAKIGDIILVSGPTVALTHMVGVYAIVSANDTVTLIGQADSTGFTGASKVYNYVLFRQS